MIKILPLGGCGEIGMNMTVLQVADKYFFIDCGGLFPDAKTFGVDLIVPDVSVLIERNIKPTAWLITHGHEDHIGALPWLYKKFPAPLYCYGFAKELIVEKMRDNGGQRVDIREWTPYSANPVDGIKVTTFFVNHSIPDSLGFFIETKFGNIVHPGDYRIDQYPPEGSKTTDNIKRVVQNKPVTLLMSDSTNSFSQGRDKNEIELLPQFESILQDTHGAVVATTFSSNLWRINSLLECAKRCDRKVLVFGRSMRRNLDIAIRMGHTKLDGVEVISEDRVNYVRKSELLVICTGSQGEVTSSLYRIATRGIGDFVLEGNDVVVFSSRAIPGNERSIADVSNLIARHGTRVITARDCDIHVSGHGYQEDQKEIIRAVKPRYFMPVHGEYRHLQKQASSAMECGVPSANCFVVENGDVLRVDGKDPGIDERVESGRDYICAGGPLSERSEIYRERLQIGRVGVVHAIFTTDVDLKRFKADPVLTYVGVPDLPEDRMNDVKSIFFDCVAEHQRKKTRTEKFEEDLRLRLRRYLESSIGFKTKIILVIQKLP